jgi:hypothetical protein
VTKISEIQQRKSLSLDASISLGLLLAGLETTMSKLGGSVHELELDLLKGIARGLGQ